MAAACKALHRCSLSWFAQVNVKVPFDAPHKVAHLAAWLRHHPGEGLRKGMRLQSCYRHIELLHTSPRRSPHSFWIMLARL